MFDENYHMKVPVDKDSIIWRYMSFEKFVSLLSKEALYFCNSKCFEDKHEGAFAKKNIGLADIVDILGPVKDFTQKKREQNQIYRETIHINCWHLNKHESIGMWKNYLDKNMGVAIKSTYNRFSDAVMNDLERMVFMGEVKYIDYNEDMIPYDEGLWANFLRKRKEFKDEKEIRAMYLLSHNKVNDKSKIYGGYVQTELDKLIEEVVISPDSPNWFKEVVESTIKAYGFKFNVRSSSINNDPIY